MQRVPSLQASCVAQELTARALAGAICSKVC